MPTRKVRIGFVPTFRFTLTPWCERMLRESIDALSAIDGMELILPTPSADGKGRNPATGEVPSGCVNTLDDAEALATYYATQHLDGLIVCPLDFGDERAAGKVAEKLGLPVLLYATKEPAAGEDASLQRLSDSYCGNLALAAAMHRRKIRFHWAGLFMPDEPALRKHVEEFLSAVSIIKGLRNARFGQIGQRPPAFESTCYDEIALARKFGQNVIMSSFADLADAANALSDEAPAVRAIVQEIQRTFAQVTISHDSLLKAAKFEAATMDFVNANGLSGVAMQCWPQNYGINMCSVLGRLTGRGILAACETDILGTISMLISHRSTLCRSLPHLIDWTIQHRSHPNRVLGWHCGNAPVCLASDAAQAALRSRMDMTGELPVPSSDPHAGLAQFQIRSGPVTICRLAEYDGAWRLLIVPGKIVPSEETLAGTWAWIEVANHDRLYRLLVENGFIHHASLVHGDQLAGLKMACKFLEIEPVLT